MSPPRRERVLLLAPMLPGAGFWGRHQRFALLGRAIGRFADIEALVFVRGAAAVDTVEVERVAREEWQTGVRIHVVPATGLSASHWRRWVLSPVDFRRQPEMRTAAGRAQLAAIEERLAITRPDRIVAFGIDMMVPLLAIRGPLPPVDLDLDDVPHVRKWRELRLTRSPIRRGLLLSQIPGLLWAERRSTALARRSLVCSRVDRDYLEGSWRLPRIEVFPNAVRIPEMPPPPSEPSLLFIGQLAYPPNATAAQFLIDEVWPRVRAELPLARLRIVGPSPEVVRRGRSGLPAGVDVTGVVEDLDALYAKTAVACAPIRAGSGTRIKILEAAAFGRAVVSTPTGAEGLELVDGRDILLRAGARGFASACTELLSQPEAARRLGSSGRQRVSELYDRSLVLDRLSRLLAS